MVKSLYTIDILVEYIASNGYPLKVEPDGPCSVIHPLAEKVLRALGEPAL